MKTVTPLELLDGERLSAKFKKLNTLLSEYSFANLFLFRSLHSYELIKVEGLEFITGKTRDGVSVIMPTIHPKEFSEEQIQKMGRLASCFFPIPQNWLPCFPEEKFKREYREEDSDYLFSLSSLAALSGRHLSGQRNQIKQLFSKHQVSFQFIDNQDEALFFVLNEWQKRYQSQEESDYVSCSEAISKRQLLHLQGLIVFVNEDPAGFIIGELLSATTFVVHFSKALIKGVYPYQLSELAKSLLGTCTWINLEQDLGLPNLRAAKQSYHPAFLAKKWRIFPL